MSISTITEGRIKHMLGVARKCYTLSKEKGDSEELARSYFMMGLLHDVGYEFSPDKSEHPEIGANMLESFTKGVGVLRFKDMIEAIRLHGTPHSNESLPQSTQAWLKVLNEADLTVNSDGSFCTIDQRIADIEARYGKDSSQAKQAKEVADTLTKI